MNSRALAAALSLVLVAAVVPAQKKKAPVKKTPVKKTAPAVLAMAIEVLQVDGEKLTPVKDGLIVSGERTFRVRVTGRDPIASVEFSVGGDLRDTDGSTPYEFKVDALAEEDGPLTLTFKGYSSTGASASRTLKITVDNGVGLGLEAQLKRGNDALNAGRYDEAINAGRVALKIDEKSSGANLLLARAYLGTSSFDRAQKYAEDAITADAQNLDAQETLAAVGVQRAFRVVNRGTTERAESLRTTKEALTLAVDARLKVDEARYTRVPADAAPTARADAALEADRPSAVIALLDPLFRTDVSKTDVANRLAYAHLLSGDLTKAAEVLNILRRSGKYDAYSYALDGLLLAERGDAKGSEEALKNGLLENPESLGVRSAQASIALKNGRVETLRGLAVALGKDVDSRSEANYFLSAVSARLGSYDVARANFERGVRIDPANHDLYLEQGNQAVQFAQNDAIAAKEKESTLASAEVMYGLALRARPSSPSALVGLTLVALLQNKPADATKFAEAATKAGPNLGSTHYAYLGALSLRRRGISASIADPAVSATDRDRLRVFDRELGETIAREQRTGRELDPKGLEGRPVPSAVEVYRYFVTVGRTPLITPPSRG